MITTRSCIFLGTILAVAAVLTGCNTLSGVPKIESAAVTPEPITPGTTAMITVKVKDRQSIIDRVEGVVTEDERITLRLQDDGVPPDEAAGDGVWSLMVELPAQAPTGDFEIVFTAYRGDGIAVPVRNEAGQVVPLQAKLALAIQHAQQ